MRVWLLENESGCAVEASLTAMAAEHVSALNATWVPEFHRRQDLGLRDQDFLMWKTGVKFGDLFTHREAVQRFVVARAGEVQGVLALQQTAEAARLHAGEQLLIVRYLAAAPWNRRGKMSDGRYRRTGTVLLGQAVRQSIAAGCDGRLGLHSLSSSDAFYHKLGFGDMGPDPAARGLRYFELSVATAARLHCSTALATEHSTRI